MRQSSAATCDLVLVYFILFYSILFVLGEWKKCAIVTKALSLSLSLSLSLMFLFFFFLSPDDFLGIVTPPVCYLFASAVWLASHAPPVAQWGE